MKGRRRNGKEREGKKKNKRQTPGYDISCIDSVKNIKRQPHLAAWFKVGRLSKNESKLSRVDQVMEAGYGSAIVGPHASGGNSDPRGPLERHGKQMTWA